MSDPRYRRVPGLVRRPVGSETLLYDPRDGSLHVLNPTAALVWEELSEPRSLSELATSLRERFAVMDAHDLDADLRRLVEGLSARQLVVAGSAGS